MLAKFLFLLCTYICAALALVIDLSISKEEQAHLTDDPEVTHKLTFQISRKSKSGDAVVGELVLGLFGATVPKTVENFVQLSTLEQGFGYKDSIFHRIIKGFMIQGGDFERADGTGGYSIYNKGSFANENFKLKHNKKGRLSMANGGPDTNGAQFFILTGNGAPHLDGHHVVFGQLVLGFDTLEQLNNAETGAKDRPVDDWLFNLHDIQTLALHKTETEEVSKVEESEGSEGEKAAQESFESVSSSSDSHRVPFFVWLVVFFAAGYYGMRLRRRRKGITITGFRS